jgi:hypothetical protein
MERNDTMWRDVLLRDDRVRTWWDQVQDRPDLHEKAIVVGGRGAKLVQAYRQYCAEFDACSAELERIRGAQSQINTATLNEVGVV